MAHWFRPSRWLLAGLVAALPLAAPSLWAPQAEAKAPNEYHLFVWKVTTPGAAADAPADYLIGTMHLPVAQGLTMPAPVRQLIAEATAVVTEADTRDIQLEVLQKYTTLKGGKTLKQLLPAASWAKLVIAKPMGFTADLMVRMEPWFLAVGLMYPPVDDRPVIDDLVEQEARQAKVAVSHLETFEEQLRIMDSVRQEEDVRQLVDALDQPGRVKAQIDALKRGYFAGNRAAVERLILDPTLLKTYPDFHQKLLFERNARWVPKVDQLFKGEDAVVAVGLGHMLGDKGLVKLLKAKGYSVEPLAL
ncbi:TraB family protein [compost metagenome]